ncbi:hypothetical protein SASPL_145161 [Salvia splendens]|uniref:Integrin alpha FG-GAP repeat containing protein 1 n=1 Tax=Salvia splendens TaxID=180675 RepID=A0A8X8Z748_SALSN|nr:hypothetical protein SASPL_145161 [Salvia splendens]
MRKRDLAILMLSAFAIFFSLQHEGDFSFKEAWFHLSDEYPVKYEGHRLPPPILTDLNGDGKKEVLIATHDAKIQLTGRRAVAMATGVIEKTYDKREARKQLLVVVTSGWSVMCFDHNLKKLWEENLQKDFPHNAHHREIAISVSNYTLRYGDAGLVIVGGRMEMQPHMHIDPFEEIEMAEKKAEEHRRSATEKDESESAGTVDLRHFAFYAFSGRSGELRWTRKKENIEAQASDAAQLIPQHNYKLDVHALNTRHPGEFECRECRESILAVMPHRWERREDTMLKLAHFRRHKRKTLKKLPGKTTNYPLHKPEEKQSPGKDVTKKISTVIDKTVNMAKSAKTKKNMPYIPTIINYTQLWWVPYVVVAHEKEGIEAVHLASGHYVRRYKVEPSISIWDDRIYRHSHAKAISTTPTRQPSNDSCSRASRSFSQVMILAAGDQEAVVLSPGGALLTSVDLPAPPTHSLVCDDFSNDGLTDLILVTSSGVYGFVQTRQPGALFFSTLVGCLIVVMGVLFVSQYLNSGKGKPRMSSQPL